MTRISDACYFGLLVSVMFGSLVLGGDDGRRVFHSTVDPDLWKQQLDRPLAPLNGTLRPLDEMTPPDFAENIFARKSDVRAGRQWSESSMHWSTPELHHGPLYFEDVPLERYGQTPCRLLQPVFSAARFYGGVLSLPYKMTVEHPHSPVYTNDPYQAGGDVPCLRQKLTR